MKYAVWKQPKDGSANGEWVQVLNRYGVRIHDTKAGANRWKSGYEENYPHREYQVREYGA